MSRAQDAYFTHPLYLDNSINRYRIKTVNQKLIKVICGLAMLGSMLTTSARADLMTLNYSGYFGPTSTLGGTAFGVDTAFSLTGIFNTDSLVSFGTGLSSFTLDSFSMVINGTGYTGSPSAGLFVGLADPRFSGCYAVGLGTSDLNRSIGSQYSTSTPAFLADSPTSIVFSDYTETNDTGNFQIALTGVDGGLVVNDEGAQNFTASITPAAVPEPSTFALIGLGVIGLAAYRRKRAA